jgi:hypothetical protein
MFKKIATAAILTGGLALMGSTAFADAYQITGDDYKALASTAKHGNCTTQDNTRVCTNFNGVND